MGFGLNLKWGFSVQQPFSSNSSSSSWPSSFSYKGREAFYDSANMSFSSVDCGNTETLSIETLRVRASTSEMMETNFSDEVEIVRGSTYLLYKSFVDDIQMPIEEDKSFIASMRATKASHFGQLLKNLDILEETLTDSDATKLKRDILMQLDRLGALGMFHECLSRTLNPNSVKLSDTFPEFSEDTKASGPEDSNKIEVFIPSSRKETRKLRSKRASEKGIDISTLESQSQNISDPKMPKVFGRSYSKSRGHRWKVIRNEAELSRGVKLLAELERIKNVLEEESGQLICLSDWAEAAGVENKVLQQHLHFGSYCRDQLVRSTSSLVLYIARNYRGLGVAFDDLIQAGKLGVLQGAERFDHTRGYKFSTYVQYWIRKSISMFVARHARGIRVPMTLSNTIKKIQRARKSLTNSRGKCPDDNEIAEYTGLSIAKIASASKCLRVVGSVDKKIGDGISARFMELTPDTSVMNPEETVTRQHMIKDLYMLLNNLEPRERQVLILRFGIGNHQCKSLEEIGRLFCVSKEWIRKIERTALTKLRNEDSLRNLKHYLCI